MKIIAIDNNYEVEAGSTPSMLLLADSCLLQKGRPFFVPEVEGGVRLYPSLVIKIGRLGKHIARRFAHRYWSQYGVMLHARADEFAGTLLAQGRHPVEAYVFDYCAIQGPLIPKGDSPLSFSILRNGEKVFEWSADKLNYDIDALIEYISRNNTLKTGDLILAGVPKAGIDVAIDDSITIILNNTSFRFNIK